MQAKLSTDAAALGDRRAKFSYVYSRLDKTAKKVAATYFQRGHDSKTADEFLTYLNEAYGDPQFQRNAILSVMKLRQRPGESFTLFLNKFERLLADAGNENWSDLVKIIMLEVAMDPALSHDLQTRDAPSSYVEYTIAARNLAIRRSKAGPSGPDATPRRVPRPPPSVSDDMDWEPTASVKKGNARAASQNCRRCNRPGHVSPNCPAAKPAEDRPAYTPRPSTSRRSQSSRRTRVQKTKAETVEEEDEFLSADEEGKE